MHRHRDCPGRAGTWRRSVLCGGALALCGLVGCVSEPSPYASSRPASILQGAGQPGGPPPGAPGQARATVAILAPLTGGNADRGAALVRAAQLALADPGAPTLDVRDTGGTAQGAAGAAQAALAAGASVIIGPLTAPETAAVAPVAKTAGVPVLAFTTDPSQARPGVWPMGITPDQQVRRVVGSVVAQGKSRLAAVLPDTDFGHAMGAALARAAQEEGVPAPDIHFHEAGNEAIAQAMRDVSDYAGRRGALDARIREARARHDPEGERIAADLAQQPVAPAPFDALLLADTGERLAWLSTFIAYDDVGPPAVRVLGPSLWSAASARAGSTLTGAWFAAPDPQAPARVGFDQAYTAKYGVPAPGLADFAYDAATVARAIAGHEANGQAALVRPEGFPGVDGPLAFLPDGTVRRGLALFEVRGGGAAAIEPAPGAIAPAGF